jgi:hypothetical protein
MQLQLDDLEEGMIISFTDLKSQHGHRFKTHDYATLVVTQTRDLEGKRRYAIVLEITTNGMWIVCIYTCGGNGGSGFQGLRKLEYAGLKLQGNTEH